MIESNSISVSEIRNINSWATVSSSRGVSLSLMNRALTQCNVDVMRNYGSTWLSITSEIALMAYEKESMRRLAADNFNRILMLCSQVSELARDISTDKINPIFKQLLSCNILNSLPCLKCLQSIVKYFPSPCGEFKGKLVKFLIPRMLSDSASVRHKAIRCWCHIPIIGGGGTNRKDHVFQWERQFNEVLNSLEYIISRYIDDLFTNQTKAPTDPSQRSISLPFPSMPIVEPELSMALLQRFTILCKCLSEMLKCKSFNTPVKIAFERILSIIRSCCSVLPKSFGFTTEGRTRANHLIYFHRKSLEMLQSLIESCSMYLMQYSSVVNRILANLLDIWKRPPPDSGSPEDCFSIRSDIYITSTLWVQALGWKSKFLSGEAHLVNIFLSHWVADVSIHLENLKTKENEVSKPHRRKRKKVTPNAKEETYFDHEKSATLRACALKVARLSIYSHGTALSVLVHKTLQETTIKLILDSVNKPAHPYNKWDDSRQELYHLLLALTVSPHSSWPPPVHFALDFFRRLSSNEKNLSIRSFCTEACATLSLIVRPRAPSLQRASLKYNEECVRKYKESSHPALDALHSRDLVVREDHQVTRVDAHTSTDDLVQTSSDQFFVDHSDASDDLEANGSDVTSDHDDDDVHEMEEMIANEEPISGSEAGSTSQDVETNAESGMLGEADTSGNVDDESGTSEDISGDEEDDVMRENLCKRRVDDENMNEYKRLKLDAEVQEDEESGDDDESKNHNQGTISDKLKNSFSSLQKESLTSMMADFVYAKADNSSESDVST